MKWSCLDKVVVAIFIQEIFLIFVALAFQKIGPLMWYPIFMQIAKAATIGNCLFSCERSQCGRWTAAITLSVVQALDVLYFMFWFAILGAIFSGECDDPEKAESDDCKAFGGVIFLWMVVCLFCWIMHLVSSILLCVWGCEGNNLEEIKAKEKKEA